MKCHFLLTGKKKEILSAEIAQRVVKVRGLQNKSCQKTTQLAGKGCSDKKTVFDVGRMSN